MSYVQTKAFILRVVPYRDSNVLLDILTPEHGLITVTARGVKRKNSPLKILLSPFIFGEFELFYYRERYQVNAFNLIESYGPLMEDLRRLTCLAHLAELVLDVLRYQAKAANAYSFWAYASYVITFQEDPILKTHLAQLKFISDQGFSPWFQDCLNCHDSIANNYQNFYFNKGGVLCEKPICRKLGAESSVMLISSENIKRLIYFLQLPYEKCFNIQVDNKTREELIMFSKRYLNFVMEKQYKKLDMLVTMEKFEKGIYE